jgi:hypothetical protein
MDAAYKEAYSIFDKCLKLNDKNGLCYNNYADFSARAAYRVLQTGGDPQPYLRSTRNDFAKIAKLGLASPDSEQHWALAAWVDAGDLLRRSEDPTTALAEAQAALNRCLALAADDVRCRTLNAQLEWLRADWLAQQAKPFALLLQDALRKAELATQSPEKHPEAFRVLAETRLRLANAESTPPAARARHVADGLASLERLFAINPNHAAGWGTQGALLLVRARQAKDAADKKSAAAAAAAAIARALGHEPLLKSTYAALQAEAGQLSASP